MIKNRDLPTKLRGFNEAFSGLVRRYEPSRVFDDLLSIICACMAHQTQEKWYFEVINRYEKKELDYFVRMFAELQLLYAEARHLDKWFDPLGSFYEELASRSKKSAFGQFFTPEPLCEMLAQMTVPAGEWGKTINEPCAGSGRMILACNQIAPGNYYVAQDKDQICAKMTAVNMCFHEIRGEVHCMDVIAFSDPIFSFKINHEWHKHKVMNILKMKNPS